jgi:hypothetical protein
MSRLAKNAAARAKKERLRELAGGMPPLLHYPDQSSPFDPAESRVLKWISQRPELVLLAFNKLRDSGAIVFDPETRTWRGCHYDFEEDEWS